MKPQLFSHKSKTPGDLPKWLNTTPYGKPLKREILNKNGELMKIRIVPFKTPLSKDLDQFIPEDKRLHPDQLIKHYQEQNVYLKGQQIPYPQFLNLFNSYMINFEKQMTQDNEYIGVHCTHGKNRTGLMIVQYLCKVKNIELDVAFKEFNEARAPETLDKEMYLEYLHEQFSYQKNINFDDTKVTL
eukprot:403361009